MIQFTPRQILKRQLVIYPIAAALAIVGLWIYWAVAAGSADSDVAGDNLSVRIRLNIAVAGTAIIPIASAISQIKGRALLTRGVQAQAKVVQFGAASSEGRQLVTYEYLVGRTPYRVTQSCQMKVLDQYQIGTVVPVIYDPAKPGRAQVFTSYEVNVEPDTFADAGRDVMSDIYWGGLLLGQMIAAVGFLALIGKPYAESAFGPACLGVIALTLLEMRLTESWAGAVTDASKGRTKLRDRCMVGLGLLSLIWTPLAIKGTYDGINREAQYEAERTAERAEQKKNEIDPDTLEKMRQFQEKYARPAPAPKVER